MNITIRKGTKHDLPGTLALIQELAKYERAPHEVTNTLQEMEKEGFRENPLFWFYVAEHPGEGIIGIALYYFAYSTWKGRTLYLEDIVITEQHRRKGLGKLLFDAVAQAAHDANAKRMAWQVLDWNEPAIAFYQKIGATLDGEWINCRMTPEQLQQYLTLQKS